MGAGCSRGFKKPSKKKELNAPETPLSRLAFYQSSLKTLAPEPAKVKQPNLFLAPEFMSDFSPDFADSGEMQMDLQNASSWDIATRYHEFKSMRSVQGLAKRMRSISASAILERARSVLGSVVRPIEQYSAPLLEVPFHASQIELDIEETIDQGGQSGDIQDLWMSYATHRAQPIILSVDTSLSMTGEKLALTAVALAVVLLEFPDDPIGIVAFENEAKVLKDPGERISIQLLVERFLDVPAQGYTHLEEGMKAALKLVQLTQLNFHGRPPSSVLLTDGKYTAGKDPAYLGSRFPHLVVLKMGNEQSSLGLCRELAQKGRGALREVDDLEDLPTVMYGVVKDLLRGRSIA